MALLTVSQLNFYIKSLFDGDRNLHSVMLSGEISNFTDHYRTGHLYLSLKDEKSAIKAVMFASNAARMRFHPENGMKVIVRGSVSVYQVTGQYQLYIEDMQPDGAGSLSVAFEQLKKKLAAEGLFDSSHKLMLPELPMRIGVITSPTGAAVQDILRILSRRFPLAEIILCPVAVQGEYAAAQLTDAVRRFSRLRCVDVIIIGRGGGSAEDLWAFNDEALCRAIYDCPIPVVSGVGHETDFTLCDFAADVRASTPSAAAELVSPEQGELENRVRYLGEGLVSLMKERLLSERKRLDALSSESFIRSPKDLVNQSQMRLDMLSVRLKNSAQAIAMQKKNDLMSLASKLDTLSPLNILARGYAIAEKDGKPIVSAKEADHGDQISVRLSDGRISCKVI